jgi:peptidoglycan/LPS O-acetylase OafA/YrhL
MTSFVDELGRELSAAGIRGRRRTRIVAELTDHLRCDPTAALGAPRDLARQFADELGTSRARRGAFAVFAALAVAAAMLATFLIEQFGPVTHQTAAVNVAGGVLLVASQVAFAAGVLGALRAIQRRRVPSVPHAEAVVIVRRSWVALGAGLVSMAALAVAAIVLHYPVHTSARPHALVIAAVGAAALLAVAPSVIGAARLLPSTPGDAGDIFDDIGRFTPAALRGRPWRVALLVAGGLALATAAAGVVQSDPYDGLLRAVAEATVCLAGFALLGPFLGLWSPRRDGAAS